VASRPAAAASYRGIPHLLVGFLFQNPISFAYTKFLGDFSKPATDSAARLVYPWPWLVREVGGLHVEGQLAPRHFDHNPDQPGLRAG
jgi:hypothetical protein